MHRPAPYDTQSQQRPRRFPLWPFLSVLIATIMLTQPVTAPAQTSSNISVSESNATADFPTTLTFQLTAEAASPITQIELYWRATKSPTVALARPDFEPAARVELTHAIDMTINYLPPGVDIEFWWRITDAAGETLETTPQTYFYMDDDHDWESRNSGQLTVWWYQGGDDFADAVLDSANGALARLSDRFQVTTDAQYQVIVYANDGDFEAAQAANSADWIGGLAYPGLDLVVAQIAPAGGAPEIGRLVPHEVSHLILFRATENPYNTPPAWLDEGLATYNQDTPDTRLDSTLDAAIRDGALMPVQALNGGFPLDPDQALLAYAESLSIVEFIIASYGDEALARLIAIFRESVTYEAAVESTLGVSIAELDAAWKVQLDYSGDDPDRQAGPAPNIGSRWDNALLFTALTGGACLLFVALAVAALVVLLRARRKNSPHPPAPSPMGMGEGE